MTTFKEFHNKNILGLVEKIRLLDFPEVGEITAKVDTGNEAYNVLHGTDIQSHENNVTFKTIDGKEITLPKIDSIVIHIGSGVKEERPVVKLNFSLGNKVYRNMLFSIADRSENEEAILLGEPFLRQTNSIVDVKK